MNDLQRAENDPLKPWVREASWGRAVARLPHEACGFAEPWEDLPCDFVKGHPTTQGPGGEPLLFGGHNSTTSDSPCHLNAVTRAQRHQDGTSPLSRP